MDKRKIQRDFTVAAPHYSQHALLQRQIAYQLYSEVRHFFPPHGTVMDAGCGSGFLYDFVKQDGVSWAIYPFDIAYGMCQHMQQKISSVVCADAELIPYKAGTFDAVFSSLMLQWVDSFQQAMQQIHYCLKPNGFFAVTTLIEGTLQELKESFEHIDQSQHIHQFPAIQKIKDALQDIGFTKYVIEESPIIQKYQHVMQLLKSIKMIGAHYKRGTEDNFTATKTLFHDLQQEYQAHFSDYNGMIEATWDVITIKGIK